MQKEFFEFKKAFEYKKLTFYGGPADKLFREGPWDLVIRLSNVSTIYPETKEIPEFLTKYRNALLFRPKSIDLNWADMGAPDLSKSAWRQLVNDVRKTSGRVAVCCMGGHGRTGTALSILYALLTGDKNDPIKKIRDNYDILAVESESQIEYIEFITGIDSKENPSKGGGGWYYSDYNTSSTYSYTSTYNPKFCDCRHSEYSHVDNNKDCKICECVLFRKERNYEKDRDCVCGCSEWEHFYNKNIGMLQHCTFCNCCLFSERPKKVNKPVRVNTYDPPCTCSHYSSEHFSSEENGKVVIRYCNECKCPAFYSSSTVFDAWPKHKAVNCVSKNCPYHGGV